MKLKTLAGCGIFVLAAALLLPLYAGYGVLGYVLTVIVSLIIAGISYVIAGAAEGRHSEIHDATIQAQKDIAAGCRQLAEQHGSFVHYSEVIQQKLLKGSENMSSFQQESLQQLERTSQVMISIASGQHEQVRLVTEQLGEFTSRIIQLFEGRLKEEFEAIQAANQMIGQTLAELKLMTVNSADSQSEYQSRLETTYRGIAEHLNNSQKDWMKHLKQHMTEMKLAVEDAAEDTGRGVKDILKSQKRDVSEAIEEMRAIQDKTMQKLEEQGEYQKESVEILKKLQSEILSLNQQDINLISKLMERV